MHTFGETFFGNACDARCHVLCGATLEASRHPDIRTFGGLRAGEERLLPSIVRLPAMSFSFALFTPSAMLHTRAPMAYLQLSSKSSLTGIVGPLRRDSALRNLLHCRGGSGSGTGGI
jgi:hypothetical protein